MLNTLIMIFAITIDGMPVFLLSKLATAHTPQQEMKKIGIEFTSVSPKYAKLSEKASYSTIYANNAIHPTTNPTISI